MNLVTAIQWVGVDGLQREERCLGGVLGGDVTTLGEVVRSSRRVRVASGYWTGYS
jgi:hypothetical protein